MNQSDISSLNKLYKQITENIDGMDDMDETDDQYDYLPEQPIQSVDEFNAYFEEHDLWTAVGEILGDYGNYEANMRPASTVDAGIVELKDLFHAVQQRTGVDNNTAYQAAEKFVEEYHEENSDYEDDMEEAEVIVLKDRELHMIWSAIFGENKDAAPRPGHNSTPFGSYEQMRAAMQKKLNPELDEDGDTPYDDGYGQ